MAVDRNRLAAALAYKQAEEERRRQMMQSVPVPGPVQAAPPSRNLRRDLENLSIGIGEGLVNQLEGVKGIVTDPVGSVRGAYEAVKGVVRDPSVLADALRYTAQKAGSGPLGAGEVIGEMVSPMRGKAPVMREIDVYHGTPHKFPATEANPLGEFDASKIGTGEGAQAFGHGIYLAEKPNVAQDYQFMLSKIDPETVTYQGKPVQKWYDMAQAEQDRAHRSGNRAAIDQANAKLAYWENVMTRRHPEDVKRVANDPDDGWSAFANYANSLDMKKFKGLQDAGSLYTADLPDEMVDRMLDWDKRISDQPEFVQKAWADWRNSPQAKKLANQMTARGNSAQDIEKMFANPTGEKMHKWIYEGYGSSKGGEKPKVANFLKEKGVIGVKYQDAGSRSQGGTGTRNFVVFPGEEKKVKILKRE